MLHKPWLLLIYFDLLILFGQGIPDQLAVGGCSMKLPPDLLPEAADCYHWKVGSSLTQVSLLDRNRFATVEYEAATQQNLLLSGHFCVKLIV